MMVVARGLGKGLGALLGSDYAESEGGTDGMAMLHVNAIVPSAQQPRREFSTESLEELSQSIRIQGVLQPIIVRMGKKGDGYELVAGERRWRAAKKAGLEEIPALIRDLSDKESLELALIENIQREDLNPMEQATALRRLQSLFETTQQDLAERTGLSRSHIANLMRLLQLPEEIQEDIRNQKYSSGHGRVLVSVTDPESQETLRLRIIEEDLSVRVCEQYAAHWKETGRFPFQPAGCRKAPQPGNPVISGYEKSLHSALGVKRVRIRGNEDRGSMTVSYRSRDEFLRIMAKLGVHEAQHVQE